MTIDARAFSQELAALADRFGNKTPSKEMIRRYKAFLDEEFSTEEFQRAAHAIYVQDQYWPSPVRFLQVLGRDPQAKAAEAWEVTMTSVRDGTGLLTSSVQDPAWQAALRAVGHTGTLMTTKEDQLSWVRKEFVREYERASVQQSAHDRALPSGRKELGA